MRYLILAKLVSFGAYLSRTILRPSNIPVAIAMVVILAIGSFAEYLNRSYQIERLRGEVLDRASVIRAKLEGNINGNLQLVRGLVAMVEMEPDMTQERFAALATGLVDKNSPILNIAAAPDLVVSMVYPVAPNRAAIGLDYNKDPIQRAAAIRARDTEKLILAGPVDLVQGGRGFIGRFPVFRSEKDGSRSFWGLVSVVIDVERMYRDSGLLDENLDLKVTITGRDALGAEGERFYGGSEVLLDEPVLVDVMLPFGSWRIAVAPEGGWVAPTDRLRLGRMFIALSGTLILLPMFLTGRLIDQRQRYIGELHARETELDALSRKLRLALETSRVGVWEMRLGEDTEIWDDRTNELLGYPADGGPRDFSHWLARVHPDDLERAKAEFRAAVDGGRSYASEYRLLLDGGEVRYIRSLGSLYDSPGETPRMIGINWDVSADVARNEDLRHANMLSEARNAELEAAKERIEYNALHDSLTGLPNRRYLDEVMAQHVEKFATGERAALLHIDLDRFKQINDTLGHAAGDAMLVHAAHLLREVVGTRDFVARIGGDEFVVMIRRDQRAPDLLGDHLATLADTVVTRMREPVMFQGHECRFGVSVGIATDTDSISDPKRLLINADMALYRAKNRGRNRHQFFNDALQAEIVTTKRVADEILSGLENNQFVPHYQPQFSAETHEVIGVEALARWNHPTEGLLAPNSFIRIAEELNVVASIDRLILEQTLRDLRVWQDAGLAIPKASVNVSARRLQDEELVASLGSLDIQPNTISFELVESIFLDEQDELISWNVDRIKDLGIDIEIDDFGTGYASIVSLIKLKPRRLKIDRQLIMPIVHSSVQRQLVGSIIDIGKSLGIEVLAEGVETMEHAEILRQLGCDALQGYAFARAMSAAELADFVPARRWRAAS